MARQMSGILVVEIYSRSWHQLHVWHMALCQALSSSIALPSKLQCSLRAKKQTMQGAKSAGCNMQAVTYQGASNVMLESGTRNPTALPSALYGCPYPSTSNGDCKPPASCNCYQVRGLSQTLQVEVEAWGFSNCPIV